MIHIDISVKLQVAHIRLADKYYYYSSYSEMYIVVPRMWLIDNIAIFLNYFHGALTNIIRAHMMNAAIAYI